MKNWLGILSMLFIAATAMLAKSIIDSGEMHRLTYVPGECEKLHANLVGFEDFAVFDDGTLVSLSSNHSYLQFALGKSMRSLIKEELVGNNNPVNGYIMQKNEVRQLEFINEPEEFFPHGLAGLSEGSDDNKILLVVNHRSNKDTIEFFSVSHGRAILFKSFNHSLLSNVNDCVMIDKNEIYCTNFRASETGTIMDIIETIGRLPWRNVVRCKTDESFCEVAASGLRMPNGIEASKDRTKVFVMSSTGHELIVFNRSDTGELTENARIHTISFCDKLSWDGNENLLAACLPKEFTFMEYMKDPDNRYTPCEVIRINPHDGRVNVIYLDAAGREFSGCTVAAFSRGQLYLGSVYGKGMLRCKGDSLQAVLQERTRTLDL